MNTTSLLLLALLTGGIAAQEPGSAAPPKAPGGQQSGGQQQEGWTEGFARAPSYRSALRGALESAVGKAKGIEIASGPSIVSRLSVVESSKDGDKEGFFDGQSEQEREWVQQQIQGFVQSYKVTKKQKVDDRNWEVTVLAKVAELDRMSSGLVIELGGNDLRSWQLERYEEGGPGRAFDRKKGSFKGPEIGEYLRRSGEVKIVSKGATVNVTRNSARTEREKRGHQLVASHRVVIEWQPLTVRSMVEKPNKARPTSGPRPEYMQGGSVVVRLRIEDLIEGTELHEGFLTIPADKPGSFSSDRLDAFVTKLVDKAKAEVAQKIFFTLRKPLVVRKWAGEGGAWFVEARMSRRIASGFKLFSVGNAGSLANPDWQPLGSAKLVGGRGAICTFELADVEDPGRIATGITEVRPVR